MKNKIDKMKYIKLFEQFEDEKEDNWWDKGTDATIGEEVKPKKENPVPWVPWEERHGIESLLGKTLVSVVRGRENGESIVFTTNEDIRYIMYHEQDCCEHVSIEDINGDLDDLIGSPIRRATEDTNRDDPRNGEYEESHLWTFYNIATIKGLVTIRWYGSSNGYYSEGVSFELFNGWN